MSTSKWRKIRVRSVSGASASLSSQCSTSTLGLVRERQSPAAAWRASRQVLFSVLIRAADSTPMEMLLDRSRFVSGSAIYGLTGMLIRGSPDCNEHDQRPRYYGETTSSMPLPLNGSIFTVPAGNLAETSSSPPSALTMRRRVEICMSDCFSSFDRLGCLIPGADRRLAAGSYPPARGFHSAAARPGAPECVPPRDAASFSWSSASPIRRMT